MFSRLKGVIDSQIAAEQARARNLQNRSATSVSRSNSRAGSGRNAQLSKLEKEKDPSEFESDSDATGSVTVTRSNTPALESVTNDPLGAVGNAVATPEGDNEQRVKSADAKSQQDVKEIPPTNKTGVSTSLLAAHPDLPPDVRVRLRKLEKIEARHTELLRSYKIVHAQYQSIEPFEKALRENTPCESISDPKPLIDYIKSFSLRADLAKEEMMRVAKERDGYKTELEKTKEKRELTASVQGNGHVPSNSDPSRSESTAIGSSTEKLPCNDIFNFDDEQEDLRAKFASVEAENQSLQSELAVVNQRKRVAEEAVEVMQKSVEDSQRELEGLKETGAVKDTVIKQLQKANESLETEARNTKAELEGTLSLVLQAERENQRKLDDAAKELVEVKSQKESLEQRNTRLEHQVDGLSNQSSEAEDLRKSIRAKETLLRKAEEEARLHAKTIYTLEKSLEEFQKLQETHRTLQRTVVGLEDKIRRLSVATDTGVPLTTSKSPAQGDNLVLSATASAASKKRNKKKRKAKTTVEHASTPVDDQLAPKEIESVEDEPGADKSTVSVTETIIADLHTEIRSLKVDMCTKDERIATLVVEARDKETLEEEIESLRDDLVNVGQDHVQAREQLKAQRKELLNMNLEKSALETKVAALEDELLALKSGHSAALEEAERKQRSLEADFQKFKQDAADLQRDLLAAQQLATTRFKDLSELRSVMDKAQQELTSLRTENTSLASAKSELTNKAALVVRLERTERELKSDLSVLGQKLADREQEIIQLKSRVSDETSQRKKSEETARHLQRDLKLAEENAKDATTNLQRARAGLEKSKTEAENLKSRTSSLETQIRGLKNERDGLKEDIDLKSAQVQSTQSLMNAMRDQTSELIIQTKEAQEQRESLEEELGEAQRLLVERTREAETMRRLLNEVESRHDSKARETREKMEVAIEERDKAEEEAAFIRRRGVRDMEELKDRVREAEGLSRRAEEARNQAQSEIAGLKEQKIRLEELLKRERTEVEDTKRAMTSMTAALDDTDNQVRVIESQKAGLRSRIEELELKYNKLLSQHKDEIRRVKATDEEGRPPRPSTDSTRRPRISPKAGENNSQTGVDLVYLKNVLLQFMELKDKNQRRQLIPALSMLLDLDRKEEQKWISVIQAW